MADCVARVYRSIVSNALLYCLIYMQFASVCAGETGQKETKEGRDLSRYPNNLFAFGPRGV